MSEEVERATRSALRRLGDVVYLSQCSLGDLIAARTGLLAMCQHVAPPGSTVTPRRARPPCIPITLPA